MNGSNNIRFTELFIDTVATHGTHWAHTHYVTRGKMQAWEFRLWLRSNYTAISKRRALRATAV